MILLYTFWFFCLFVFLLVCLVFFCFFFICLFDCIFFLPSQKVGDFIGGVWAFFFHFTSCFIVFSPCSQSEIQNKQHESDRYSEHT